MTEKQKFLKWWTKEKKKGLLDIKLLGDFVKKTKKEIKAFEEEIYEELNAIVSDPFE
jgi:hypothetical protein